MMNNIEAIQKKFQNMFIKNKSSWNLFFNHDLFETILNIQSALHLNDKMDLKDLIVALYYLESLGIGGKKKTLGDAIDEKIDANYLLTFQITAPKSITVNASLKKELIAIHHLLYQYYETAVNKRFKNNPEGTTKINYDKDLLQNSNTFSKVQISSKNPVKLDSTSFVDAERNGVSIAGLSFKKKDVYIQAIETLTNDKISMNDSPNRNNTKADLIYYAGGQQLQADCLCEFIASVSIENGEKQLGIAFSNEGFIHWQNKEGRCYADVSVSYTIVKDNDEHYTVLGSDAETLVKIEPEEIPRYQQRDKSSISPIVPVATLMARFEIKENDASDGEGYHLEVTACSIQLNTKALRHTSQLRKNSESDHQIIINEL